jgi:hypothetical protein
MAPLEPRADIRISDPSCQMMTVVRLRQFRLPLGMRHNERSQDQLGGALAECEHLRFGKFSLK